MFIKILIVILKLLPVMLVVALPVLGIINILYRLFAGHWSLFWKKSFRRYIAFLRWCWDALSRMWRSVEKEQEVKRQERLIRSLEEAKRL
jgi:hypothetical protein